MNFFDNESFWNKYLNLLETYIQLGSDPSENAVNYQSAVELQKTLNLKISNHAGSEEEIFKDLENYFHYTPKTIHPHFNNQLSAGVSFEALIGEISSFVTNSTMSTFEVSPVATLIEKQLVKELCQVLGYQGGDGIMLTGGSNANMLAIHVARNEFSSNIKQEGMKNSNLCLFVSDQAHYSFKKAVMLMGIGLENLISVESTQSGEMDARDLELKIQNAIEQGKKPFFVATTSGTTVKGAFDPIQATQQICKKYNLWHHIDGAWGGAALFSEKRAEYFSGCELADSFTFDAHKLLGTGLITSFLLTKKQGVIKSANFEGGGEYLFHPYENSEFDLGPSSLQCGRKNDALKLWIVWKRLGHDGIKKLIDNQIAKSRDFRLLVEENPRLKLHFDPNYLNVCFQVIPEGNIDINEFNFKLRFALVKNGKYLINYSKDSDGLTYFRMVFANHNLERVHLTQIIDELLQLAPSIEI